VRVTQSPPRTVDAPDALIGRRPAAAVLSLGLPLAIGLASHALINIVDLLLVGRLGEDAIRAAHVATTWNFLPMLVGNCVSTALLARLSRLLGTTDGMSARQLHVRAQRFMFWFALVVSIGSAVPAWPMVAITGLAGEAGADAVHYLVVSNLGCLPMFVLMQTTAAMRAAGEAAVPLALLVLANLLNLALDIVLLFGWEGLGIPGIGVVGAAYASVASRAIAAGLALAWLMRRGHVLSLRGVEPSRVRVAAPLLHDAWPQALQIGMRAGLVIVLTMVVQRGFGDPSTAALGIATRLDTVVLFASLGFANAATAYAGRVVAAGRHRDARAAGLWAAVFAAGLGSLFVLLLQVLSQQVVSWFLPTATSEVQQSMDLYLRTAAWSQVFGAAALAAIGAVHGAGRMIAPLVVDAFGFAVVFALLLGAALSGPSLASVYGALVVGMLAVAVLHGAFVAVGRWAHLA
jgi:Na+-driven multidrug efflux pump